MNINFTLVMQAVAFAAFIWFTSKFVWPHLMRAIETRQKQIADGLAAGEQGRQSLASAEKRDRRHDGRGEDALVGDHRAGREAQDRDDRRGEGGGQGRGRAHPRAAKAEIEQEVVRAKEALRNQVADLAVAGAVEDPEARSRRQGARRPAGVDPRSSSDGSAMAELTTIARPYAEAAFRLARDANALPAWSQMLRSRARSSPTRASRRRSTIPKLTAGDKEALVLSVCGDGLDPLARNFIRVLVEADRVARAAADPGVVRDAEERRRRRGESADRQRVPAHRRRARRSSRRRWRSTSARRSRRRSTSTRR